MKRKILLLLLIFLLGTVTCQAADVPILLYHNTYTPFAPSQAGNNISPWLFEQQLIALIDAGYQVISLKDYVKSFRGEYDLPAKPVVITFDDGYLSNYQYAFPILKKHNLKATIFVITGRMGMLDTTYPHFTWQQAREMQNSGLIDIYSHTNDHLRLSELSDEDMRLQLRRSKYIIEKELGIRCDILAFPFGNLDTRTAYMANQAGYRTICRVGDIGSNYAVGDLLNLKRYTVNGNMEPWQVIEMIEKGM